MKRVNDSSNIAKELSPVWVSVEFLSSTNRCWIPKHGAEFFTWFVLDMGEFWVELFKEVKSHVSVRV